MKNILEAIRGMSPKAMAATAVGLTVIVGAVIWLAVRTPSEKEETVSDVGGAPAPVVRQGEAVDDLSIESPAFDFSVSPLGELGLSDFSLGSDVPAVTFGNVAVNDDFGYAGKVSLTNPTVTVAAPTNVKISQPKPPTAPPSPTPPTAPPGGGTAPPAVSAGTCAQFSGVPSCSYVPSPDGQALCSQCKAAGY